MNTAKLDAIILTARRAIDLELEGLSRLSASIGRTFADTVEDILTCTGRVILVGMGKSGHVGRKIAATFASTGTPALFVHPAEASHGDLGMIGRNDIVIAISKSGQSPELKDTINYCKRFGITLIAITENGTSSLAEAADRTLLLPTAAEACPLGLAPTTSTTSTMALGDALAVACLEARDFQASQFRDFHPGGKLGQNLTKVSELMHGPDMLPLVTESAKLSDAVIEMSRGQFGCVGIINKDRHLTGIFTDGDLRRCFSSANLDKFIYELMTPKPYSVSTTTLIAEVARLFSETKIPSVFACENNEPVGIVHVRDLLQGGYI